MNGRHTYTEFRPRWYRPMMSTWWWLKRWSSLAFILRELSSVFIAWFVVFFLLLVAALGRGEPAYREFLAWAAHPRVLSLNVVTLAFVVFHAVTWFNLAPRAMVVHLGSRRVPGGWIAAANYAAWAGGLRARRLGHGGWVMARRQVEPLLWMLFSAGGVAAALLIPVLLVLFGLVFPLGWLPPPSLRPPARRRRPPAVTRSSWSSWRPCGCFTPPTASGTRSTTACSSSTSRSRSVLFCYGGALTGSIAAALLAWRLP